MFFVVVVFDESPVCFETLLLVVGVMQKKQISETSVDVNVLWRNRKVRQHTKRKVRIFCAF